jgi:hypothetical protein
LLGLKKPTERRRRTLKPWTDQPTEEDRQRYLKVYQEELRPLATRDAVRRNTHNCMRWGRTGNHWGPRGVWDRANELAMQDYQEDPRNVLPPYLRPIQATWWDHLKEAARLFLRARFPGS